MSDVEKRLAQAGHTIPEAAKPVAAYVPAIRSGRDVLTSGQLPLRDGKLRRTGRVGAEISPEEAKEDAAACALNALAAVRQVVGDLDRVEQVLRVTAYVASAPGFTAQPQVANGASELIETAFGEAGRHTRSAVGVAELPLGATVEVDIWVRLRE